jgi:hypothetical protein
MSVGNSTDLGKDASDRSVEVPHPIQLAERLKELSTRLRELAVTGARRGDLFDQVVRSVWDAGHAHTAGSLRFLGATT